MRTASGICLLYILYTIGIAFLLSSCASSKFRIEKVSLSKYFELNHVFRESHTGLLIYDIEADEVLFDYNSHKHFIPASNTKLLTFLAALKMLSDSIPSIEYCTIDDTLYFTGMGDPTLLYQNFDYNLTFDFLQKRNEKLAYISKPILDPRFGSGWSWDDYPFYYSAEKSTFPIYGNMVYFTKEPLSDYIKVCPDLFEDHMQFVYEPQIEEYSIYRDEFQNNFTLNFGNKLSEIHDEMPFIYSDELFIELLSDTLNKVIFTATDFPNCITSVQHAVPTDSILKHVLIESDNFLAEQMLLVISNQLGDTLSSTKTIKYMLAHQLAEVSDEIYWVDGSGLSRYNQVTPNAMVKVLEKIYEQIPRDRLFHLFPESAISGTLANSFTGLAGNVHAKTGSMRHVYNLSGYLETKSGKTLLFSFMNNNFDATFSELKVEMEQVLSVFVNDYRCIEY